MSEPLRLTDQECRDVLRLMPDDGTTAQVYVPIRAAFALGCKRQRERDAEYMRTTFGRCNLLTANGYMEGSDVAAAIEAQGGEKP